MKASELRIGNIVYKNKKYHRVTPSDIATTANDGLIDYLKPVELTPERLEKAGFKPINSTTLYRLFIGKDELLFKDNILTLRGANIKGAELSIKCQYLHQLQNIVYVLTANDLNIEL